MIKAVLLDVGGVLLLPGPELVRPALPIPPPSVAVLDRAHYRALAVAHATPAPDWETYFRVYAASCGVDEMLVPRAAAGLRAAFAQQVWTRIVPGAAVLLRRLRSAGMRIALVSNADGHLEGHLRALGLCRVGVEIDAILDSAIVGSAKPDPTLFVLALAELGVDANQAVHVGDTVGADVAGALAAGIRPLHYVPYGDCDVASPAHEHLRWLSDLLTIS